MSTAGSPDWHRIALGVAAACLVLIMIVVLAGCGGEAEPGDEQENVAGHVRAEDYGDEWPLTAPEAFLACTPPSAVTMRVPGHGTYAINGFAIMHELAPELEASDPVWRDTPGWREDPRIGGPKVSIGPLIDAGLELCEES